MPFGFVVQTANGTMTVQERIPPTAIMCVLVWRGGQLAFLWHRALAGQVPGRGKAAEYCVPERARRENVGRGAAFARELNSGRHENGGARKASCPACDITFVSGRVGCPICHADIFYRMTNDEMIEYTINMRNYNGQLEAWKKKSEAGHKEQEDNDRLLQQLVKEAQEETRDRKEKL